MSKQEQAMLALQEMAEFYNVKTGTSNASIAGMAEFYNVKTRTSNEIIAVFYNAKTGKTFWHPNF